MTPGFGHPRSSSEGGRTRVVFDLPPGTTYALTPTAGGLRINVAGAPLLKPTRTALGSSVTDYRVSGAQVWLVTPFALTTAANWQASEATLATGTRVLILDFGVGVVGGAVPGLRGLVTSLLGTPPVGAAGPAAPRPVPSVPRTRAGVTPSDVLSAASGVTPPAPPPPLPGQALGHPSSLTGQAQGRVQPGALLLAPRIGKNPGLTRVVLDLPPGTRYRMVPTSLGLRVEFMGVGALPLDAQDLTPELRAWRYEPAADGVTVTLLTGLPLTDRSGWRAQLVAPVPGSDRSRLAIDLSPALADLTPLPRSERVVAGVPPRLVTQGTAMLVLGTALVKPRVVLDPGHGGADPGGVGAVTEKQVALDVALRVRDLLQPAGVDVILTREADQALLPNKAADLNMRAAMGTTGTQLFLSIHVNALSPATALRGYGVETWWNPNHALSSAFAGLIQKNVTAITGAYSRGLKNSTSLAVLRASRIPAALVEIGFTSHPVDGLNLQNTNYLDRVALGIALGIREALVTGVSAQGTGETSGR
nr:N-acetylmuramoyl-L-alanine amidase [Deinococcus arcticus]